MRNIPLLGVLNLCGPSLSSVSYSAKVSNWLHLEITGSACFSGLIRAKHGANKTALAPSSGAR